MSESEVIPNRAAFVLVINSDGAILMTQRSGYLHLPGGKCDYMGGMYESYRNTVLREVAEETGIDLGTPGDLAIIEKRVAYYGATLWSEHYYLAVSRCRTESPLKKGAVWIPRGRDLHIGSLSLPARYLLSQRHAIIDRTDAT
jgi:8-oxo-dGTP pyrophosphatase MutT (NUDIX family)